MPETPEDDRRFLLDLGLVKRSPLGGLAITNPIYREVIPRVLSQGPQDSMPQIQPSWLNADGSLNPDKLLAGFLDFWRQHGEPLLKSAPYHEIAPHLVLMAFLHRVVNGAGSLNREYATGICRMDICLRYGQVTLGIEFKVWRPNKADPVKKTTGGALKSLSPLQATGHYGIFPTDRTTALQLRRPKGRGIKPHRD